MPGAQRRPGDHEPRQMVVDSYRVVDDSYPVVDRYKARILYRR